MSARKLGGGRILGSGNGLAPPNRGGNGNHSRSTSLLSVAESAVTQSTEGGSGSGMSTPLGTSPLPSQESLRERVVMGKGANGGQGTNRLVCPICTEEMMTLLQLNRHLDDDHQELPEVEQDEVKNWFEKQVTKAKKFQPLVVINQKLKGLDVFESNNELSVPSASHAGPSERPLQNVRPPDPDEVVTRTHWQRSSYNDVCTEPSCGKRLGTSNGSINCRKCGRLFCDEHTMYQMKLSRAALHEPVRGFWCRCCETCYKSREGYNDHHGLARDHMSAFDKLRRPKVEKRNLEIARLEKRLTRLTALLADPPPEVAGGGGYLSVVAGGKSDPKKTIEQSVVAWEEDVKVAKCPFCQQEFGNWTFRRHHCRICGRVVCADSRTACSTQVGLNAATKTKGTVNVDIRMCRDCKTTIFSHKDFEAELAANPPVQRAYSNLLQFERGIRPLLASFQRTLPLLQDPSITPTSQQLADAAKIRKRLVDSFGKYDTAAKRIRNLPTTSETEKKLQEAIFRQASQFLHLHMLPLKSLPKMLKHATPHGIGAQRNGLPRIGSSGSAIARIGNNDADSASQMSSSSSIQAMEAEEKELRERLIVLEEQRFLVQEMVRDANKRRKWDEVGALSASLEDLRAEIDGISGQLEGMDFQGAYEGAFAGGNGGGR